MSRRKNSKAKERRLALRKIARDYGVKVPASQVAPLIMLGEAAAQHQLACYRALKIDRHDLVVCETCQLCFVYQPRPWTRRLAEEIERGEEWKYAIMPCPGEGCPGTICVTAAHYEEAA